MSTPARNGPPLRLFQILGTIQSVKTQSQAALTALHRATQQRGYYDGMVRTYQPLSDEDADRLPDEATRVQRDARVDLREAATLVARGLDAEIARDRSNMQAAASAPLVLDGEVLVDAVPAETLIHLEKRLEDLRTVVAKLPVLDPAFEWTLDANTGQYRSAPVQTNRTRKELRNHLLAPATDKHPAQVQTYTEEVKVGTYSATKFSTALPATQVQTMLARIDALIAATRIARQRANDVPVIEAPFAAPIMRAILRDVTPF